MSNIHGLFTSKDKKPHSDSSDSEDEERRGQSFYVGGSDHSGQEVIGPPRNDIPSQLFEAAQRAGAAQMSPEEAEALLKAQNATTRPLYQSGSYRLGGHGVPSEIAQTSENLQSSTQLSIRVHLIMWSNGFSVNDGPLRRYEDAENRSFLNDLMQKKTPAELMRMYPHRKIDLHLERRNVEYVAPKAKPFSCTGQRLGSVVPNVIGASAPEMVDLEPNTTLLQSGQDLENTLKEAQDTIKLDENAPICRVQVRIGNNGPLIGRFNPNNTVLDLRNFIVTAQPSLAFQPFSLISGRPPCSIEDENKTLKDADLVNATVLVKFV